tara:strand:+ start:2747 stop:3313 length:567 start_codon:yes stop_codon:yes gene_type:complete
MRLSISGESKRTVDEGVLPSQAGQRTTCLHFSPFVSKVFLAGQLDGGCRLHHLDRPTPLYSWPIIVNKARSASWAITDMTMVSDIKWSPQRPNVFFVLYANGDLHTFDLDRDVTAPVQSLVLAQEFEFGLGDWHPKLAISSGRTLATKVLAVSVGNSVFTRPLSESIARAQDGELAAFHSRLKHWRVM